MTSPRLFLDPLGALARLRLSGILSEAKGGDALATVTVVVLDYKNPQALNRYSYVLNNPVKYTDSVENRRGASTASPQAPAMTVAGPLGDATGEARIRSRRGFWTPGWGACVPS